MIIKILLLIYGVYNLKLGRFSGPYVAFNIYVQYYLTVFWIVHVHASYMCYTFWSMYISTRFTTKYCTQFKLSFCIYNFLKSQIIKYLTIQQHPGAQTPLYIYIYIYNTLPSLTTFILLFGTVKFWCRWECHLVGTLHPNKLWLILIYINEEEEPGWGHYSTDPRKYGGSRSLTPHSLKY